MLKFEEDVEKYKSKTKGKYALFVRSDPRSKNIELITLLNLLSVSIEDVENSLVYMK